MEKFVSTWKNLDVRLEKVFSVYTSTKATQVAVAKQRNVVVLFLSEVAVVVVVSLLSKKISCHAKSCFRGG